MAAYSIKELEHLSGVKAHTIRIWEQRYSLLHPKRTETNIRFYDDEDLKLLLNIALLNQNGHKISKIAGMSKTEIAEQVLSLNVIDDSYSSQINQLIVSMIEMDEKYFDKIFSTSTLQFGFDKTIRQIIYPFLERIGILWQTDNINPAMEHFVSNLIRQKMIVAIDGQVLNHSNSQVRFILFLPEHELHELALLFAAYIIRSRHHKLLYLGQNLPLVDLEPAVKIFAPTHLCSIFTSHPDREHVQEYINKLAGTFSDTTQIFCGEQMKYDFIKLPKNTLCMNSLQDFVAYIEAM